MSCPVRLTRALPIGNIVGGGIGTVVDQAFREKKDGWATGFSDGVEQAGGIGGSGWHENVNARDVRADRFHCLGMVWAEAGAVAAGNGHDQHRRFPLAVGTPVHRTDLGEDLVVGYGEEVGKLHEGNGMAARQCLPGRDAKDSGFRQRGIMNLIGKALAEAAGKAKDITLRIFDILTEKGGFPILGKPCLEGFAHGFEHAQVPVVGRSKIFFARRGEGFLCSQVGLWGGAFAGGVECGVDLFLHIAFDAFELFFRRSCFKQTGAQLGTRVGIFHGVAQVGFGAVDGLVVGIGVAGEPLDVEDDDLRAAGFSKVGNDLSEFFKGWSGVGAVDVLDG